jgi:GNAT superfamily N-acetyltransferase
MTEQPKLLRDSIPWKEVWDEMERNNPHQTGARDATAWLSYGMFKGCNWHEEIIQPDDPRIDRSEGANGLHPASKRDVKKYIRMKEKGMDFPPITLELDGRLGKFFVWDGAHRLQAAIELNSPIRAYVGIPPASEEQPSSVFTAGAAGDLPPLTLRLSILDSRRDELFGRVEAWLEGGGAWTTGPDGKETQQGTMVGYTDFSEYENEVWIKYVFVKPEYRRKGVASAMYEKLQEEFPGEPIKSSGTTDLGTPFRKSLKQQGIVASSILPFNTFLKQRYEGDIYWLDEDIGMDDERGDEYYWKQMKVHYDQRRGTYASKFQFPLVIFREVRLDKGPKTFRHNGAGRYWATDERSAAAYWGEYTEGMDLQNWTFKALAQEQDIDWEQSLLHEVMYPEEHGIIVKEGAKLKLLGMKESNDKVNQGWRKPAWKTVTADFKEAKTMDYGKVVNVLHSLMPDVAPGLPCPDLKIVNHTRSRWLGHCKWQYGKPNTIIELQKAICADETSLKRVIAHELSHHEQFLLHWSKWQRGTFEIMARISGGHGKDWQAIADRWNAKYGKDFITVKSDESIVTEWADKPFFLLISRTSWGSPKWQVSLRLTPRMKDYMRFKNMEDYRLVMCEDRDFVTAPVIGSPKGWGYDPKNPGLSMMAEGLFKHPDLRATWSEPPPANREEEKKRREMWLEAVRIYREQKAQSEQHRRENREAFERDKARRLQDNRTELPDWYKEREPIDEKTSSLGKTSFVGNDLVWLKSYLTMTDAQKGEELARNWTRDFLVFLKRTNPALFRKLGLATPAKWKEYAEDYNDRLDAATAFFQDKDMFDKVPPAVYESFLEPQGNYIMQNDPAEAPTFLHMSYKGIVRNQWLLHYTDEPDAIARQGFTIGMGDMDKLGLTTYYKDEGKTGGYNFAVLAERANSIQGFNFGEHAVLFRASGLLTYHWADEFDQVIFTGEDARDIIPIHHDKNTGHWQLPSDSNGKPVFEAEDIQDVVDWAINNLEQYRWMSQHVGDKVRPPKPTTDYLKRQEQKKQDRLRAGFTAAGRRLRLKPRSWKAFLRQYNQPYEPEDMYKEYSLRDLIGWLNGLELPLTVYRAVEVPRGQQVNLDNAGVYWTWVADSADVYGGPSSVWGPEGKKGEHYTLTAIIEDENDIDWEGTLKANVVNPEENEIRVMPSAHLRLVEVDGPDNKPVKMDKVITADSHKQAEGKPLLVADRDGWITPRGRFYPSNGDHESAAIENGLASAESAEDDMVILEALENGAIRVSWGTNWRNSPARVGLHFQVKTLDRATISIIRDVIASSTGPGIAIAVEEIKKDGCTGAERFQAFESPEEADAWLAALSPKTGALKPVRTPALKAWFGNSKVVDAKGEPLVVYHGSKSPWVSSFDLGMAGHGWAGASTHPLTGIWFTDNRQAAKYFADYGPKRRADEEEFVEYGEDGEYYSAVMPKGKNIETAQPLFSVGPYDDPQRAEKEARNQALLYNRRLRSDTHTMAVYLKIENPLVMDGNAGPPRTPEFYQAKQEGRDGIICTDVFDGAYKSTIYVVFNPNQIKSADRNTGAFDPEDLTITADSHKLTPNRENEFPDLDQGESLQGYADMPECIEDDRTGLGIGELEEQMKLTAAAGKVFSKADVARHLSETWHDSASFQPSSKSFMGMLDSDEYELRKVNVKEIMGASWGCYDNELARRFSKMDTDFPPIVLSNDPSEGYVFDGHHRLTAALCRGDKEIWAFVPVGWEGVKSKTAASAPWLYHVTYFNRLEDILFRGLEPNHPANIGGQHGWHTKDRSFLTEWRGVGFWYSREVQWAYHNSDHPVEDGLTPVVLRTREFKHLKTQEDEIGTSDAGAEAAFTEKTIPSNRLQVWNGHKWVRLSVAAVAAMTPEGYEAPNEDEWVDEDSKEYTDRYIDDNALYPKTATSVLDRMPSWDQFVKQNGGIEKIIESFGEGWERWEPWDPEEEKEFDALPPEEQQAIRNENAYNELESSYNDILDRHMFWAYPLTVYRAMTLTDIKDMRTKGVGVYWAWDEEAAQPHWGYGEGAGSVVYTLKAQVGERDIDWKGTIWANLDPNIGDEEKEIRLKEKCHPVLVAWRRGNEEWQVPLRQWRTMTANKDS